MVNRTLSPDSFLDPPEVPPAIKEKYGLHTTDAALAQQRSRGKGFPYRKINGRVKYLWGEVCEDIERQLAQPLSCTRSAA